MKKVILVISVLLSISVILLTNSVMGAAVNDFLDHCENEDSGCYIYAGDGCGSSPSDITYILETTGHASATACATTRVCSGNSIVTTIQGRGYTRKEGKHGFHSECRDAIRTAPCVYTVNCASNEYCNPATVACEIKIKFTEANFTDPSGAILTTARLGDPIKLRVRGERMKSVGENLVYQIWRDATPVHTFSVPSATEAEHNYDWFTGLIGGVYTGGSYAFNVSAAGQHIASWDIANHPNAPPTDDTGFEIPILSFTSAYFANDAGSRINAAKLGDTISLKVVGTDLQGRSIKYELIRNEEVVNEVTQRALSNTEDYRLWDVGTIDSDELFSGVYKFRASITEFGVTIDSDNSLIVPELTDVFFTNLRDEPIGSTGLNSLVKLNVSGLSLQNQKITYELWERDGGFLFFDKKIFSSSTSGILHWRAGTGAIGYSPIDFDADGRVAVANDITGIALTILLGGNAEAAGAHKSATSTRTDEEIFNIVTAAISSGLLDINGDGEVRGDEFTAILEYSLGARATNEYEEYVSDSGRTAQEIIDYIALILTPNDPPAAEGGTYYFLVKTENAPSATGNAIKSITGNAVLVEKESLDLVDSDTENNIPPVANILTPNNGNQFYLGEDIEFTQASYDDDDPFTYIWDFNDTNTAAGDSESRANYDPIHSYGGLENLGQKYITLTVTDARGKSDTDQVSILILDSGTPGVCNGGNCGDVDPSDDDDGDGDGDGDDNNDDDGGSTAGETERYIFSFVDNPESGSTHGRLVSYDSTGTYVVDVTTGADGCSKSISCIAGFCPQESVGCPVCYGNDATLNCPVTTPNAPATVDDANYDNINFCWVFDDGDSGMFCKTGAGDPNDNGAVFQKSFAFVGLHTSTLNASIAV